MLPILALGLDDAFGVGLLEAAEPSTQFVLVHFYYQSSIKEYTRAAQA